MPDPRLVYFESFPDATFGEILGRESTIRIERLRYAEGAQAIDRAMSGAAFYHLTSASNELPARYRADQALLARAPALIAVSVTGSGTDTVDTAACTAAGVALINQAGGNAESVAEHVLAMMIGLSKRIVGGDRALRRERGFERDRFRGRDIFGRTVGIIGLGHIGSRLAEICAGTFAMRVLAYDPYLTADEIAARRSESTALTTLLNEADFVSVNCPLTGETRGMIDGAAFQAMKPGAYFITTARGGIHDEAALRQALERGHLAGAGLDVWAAEPPPLDHPLLGRDDVIVSPHIAGVTEEGRRNMAISAARQLIDLMAGRQPANLVNPEVWPRVEARLAVMSQFENDAG